MIFLQGGPKIEVTPLARSTSETSKQESRAIAGKLRDAAINFDQYVQAVVCFVYRIPLTEF